MAKGKIDPSERLFNLTLALIFSRRGLTKSEIFSKVHGYLAPGKTLFDLSDKELDAMDRLFDRDKNDLLQTGIQLIGGIPKEALGDASEFRYRIPHESLSWPSGMTLNARQIAMLNLAADVWAQASISTDAARAVMRLRALGEKPEDSGLYGVAPNIRTHEAAFKPLTDAIDKQFAVEFEYRKPNSESSELRRVQPWMLQNISGQWLLVCYDLKRRDVRNFLLKRIVSKVTETDDEFERPDEATLERAVNDLHALISDQVAHLKIKPQSEAWLHFELAADSDGEHEIHYMDLYLLAEELREFVHDLDAVRPAELHEAIAAGLQQVASDHHA